MILYVAYTCFLDHKYTNIFVYILYVGKRFIRELRMRRGDCSSKRDKHPYFYRYSAPVARGLRGRYHLEDARRAYGIRLLDQRVVGRFVLRDFIDEARVIPLDGLFLEEETASRALVVVLEALDHR